MRLSDETKDELHVCASVGAYDSSPSHHPPPMRAERCPTISSLTFLIGLARIDHDVVDKVQASARPAASLSAKPSTAGRLVVAEVEHRGYTPWGELRHPVVRGWEAG